MNIVRRTYGYSSALSQLDPSTGKFNQDEFNAWILPIRGRLMQADGMTGCVIGRYGCTVEYLPDIISDADVDSHVASCFVWAAKQPERTFFPYLRAKGATPVIKLDES